MFHELTANPSIFDLFLTQEALWSYEALLIQAILLTG